MSVSIKGTTGVTAPSFVGDGSNLDNIAFDGVNACKAWVNFNGTGTVAIRSSFNVSSITDLGTGYYKVNYTSPLVDANYVAVGSALINDIGNNWRIPTPTYLNTTTSSIWKCILSINGTAEDMLSVQIAIHGN